MNIAQSLSDIGLFRNADASLLDSILSASAKHLSFNCGEDIPTLWEGEKSLVIILKGEANVLSPDTERKVILRSLSKGDIFGVTELFDEESNSISRVFAKKKCSVIIIPANKMRILLEKDKSIMYNYLEFLCCRIRFLNKRISCFTAGSAERRLALYLDFLAFEENDGDVVRISSMNSLSRNLDIGRASLYRALDTLSQDGFLKKDGKNLILCNRKMMTKHYTK